MSVGISFELNEIIWDSITNYLIWFKTYPIVIFNPSKKAVAVVAHTLRPKQNGWHYTDNIFKYIYLNQAFCWKN